MKLKVDLFDLTKNVSNKTIRHKILDKALSFGIPFNRGMNIQIIDSNKDRVLVKSPDVKKRRNHLGKAHACALALLGEYPAGLLLAQSFPPDKYRIILSQLTMEYLKQGKGVLTSEAVMPKTMPEETDGQAWIFMETTIKNSDNEVVAICKTKWQTKSWTNVSYNN